MSKTGTVTLNISARTHRRTNFARRGDTMRFPDGRELKICRVEQDKLIEDFDLYVCTDGARTYFIREFERLWEDAEIDDDFAMALTGPYKNR